MLLVSLAPFICYTIIGSSMCESRLSICLLRYSSVLVLFILYVSNYIGWYAEGGG